MKTISHSSKNLPANRSANEEFLKRRLEGYFLEAWDQMDNTVLNFYINDYYPNG